MNSNRIICKEFCPISLHPYLEEMFSCVKKEKCNSNEEDFPCDRIKSSLETAIHFWEYYMSLAWKKTVGSYSIIGLLFSLYFVNFHTKEPKISFLALILIFVGTVAAFYSHFVGINGKFLYLNYLKHVRRLEVICSGRVHGIIFAYNSSTPHIWKSLQIFSILISFAWLSVLYVELSKSYLYKDVIYYLVMFSLFIACLYIFFYIKMFDKNVKRHIESYERIEVDDSNIM